MPVAVPVHGTRFIMVTDTKRTKSRSTRAGGKDATIKISHQRCRHNAKSTWPEYRQQFNSGAPALDSLVSSDVSAHATRIGFHKSGGKPPGNPTTGILGHPGGVWPTFRSRPRRGGRKSGISHTRTYVRQPPVSRHGEARVTVSALRSGADIHLMVPE